MRIVTGEFRIGIDVSRIIIKVIRRVIRVIGIVIAANWDSNQGN